MQKFKDDKITSVDDDIKRIQLKPGMYISYLGEKGALHLAKELTNNMTDECLNKNSPGRHINIFIDEAENTFSVMDDGRGIVADMINVICTVMHSGSKFTREGSGGSSAGENGIGTTAVNALSEMFEASSFRYGEKATMVYHEGIGTTDSPVITKIDKNLHGTRFIFKPSKKYLGPCTIQTNDFIEWVEDIIFTLPPDIEIIIDVNKKGKESSIHKVLTNTERVAGIINRRYTKEELFIEPINIFNSSTIIETLSGDEAKDIERFFGIEIAFSYLNDGDENNIISLCNAVNTIDRGLHVEGTVAAINRYLQKKTKESLSDKESKKLDISINDINSGLLLAVSVRTELNPHFVGQTKERVSNPLIGTEARRLILESLDEYFIRNSKVLTKIVGKIKANAKARLALTEVKKSVVKGKLSNLDKYGMPDFFPCNNRGKKYKEIIILEGGSAGGSADNARFKDFQALFAVKGVPTNVYDKSMADILKEGAEFDKLIKIMGCNVGAKFNLDDLEYNKIIIMTDADVDGKMMTSSISSFFIKHMPEIVEDGRLYKSISPLYKIDDKNMPFVIDKIQFNEVFEKKVSKKMRIVDINTDRVYSKKEMSAFLSSNRDYLDELTRIADNLTLHPMLLEKVIMFISDKDIEAKIQEFYPEIVIDDGYLHGIAEGLHQVLNIDKIFTKKVKNLMKYIHVDNKDRMFIKVLDIKKNDVTDDRGIMSIGEFMMHIRKFIPAIITRYKGLGELQSEELRNTTMDPSKRTLIRLTVNDLEKNLDTFDLLHSKKKKSREMLQEFLKSSKISRDEFDN